MKSMKKRFFGILLSFAMMLTMMPVLGLGQTAYADADTWSANKSFDSDASFESGVDVTNDITITIAEGKTVRVENGIYAWGKTLTVEGKGNLIVNGCNSNSGSGGSAFTGRIIVKDGKVTLTGGAGNPDGDNDTGGKGIDGNVEVRGGSFSATGGNGHTVGQAVSNTITCENGIVAQGSANGSEWSDISGTSSNKQYVRTIQTYPLWVGGTRVTSANASNITGGETVTASYTPADTTTDPVTPAKLTLSGYNNEGAVGDKQAGIYAEGNLIIETTGANNVANPSDDSWDCAIRITGDLTLQGSGTLNATCGSRAIVANAVTIESGNVSTSGGIFGVDGNITINGGVVNASGSILGLQATNDVIIKNGTVIATATDTQNDYVAIVAINNITIEGGTVTASGGDMALSGTVKNSITGTGWSDTAGTEGKADISVSSEGQDLSEYKKVQFPAVHTHIFTYTASGDTITATCSAEGCPLPPSTTGGSDHVATLTIAAPEHTTYGDGNDAAAQITDANSIKGDAKVQYQKKTGESTYDTATETAPTDAGTYKASITLGTGNNSTTASVEYTIAQKPVTVSGITAENKEYDGNTVATLNVKSAVVSGIEGGDTVELSTTSATGAFSDKKAENGKTVTISDLALTGADAANYVLSSQPTTTANITKKEVTVTGITAEDKEYDGNTNATVNCGSAVINGKVENDDLSISEPAGSFSDKNVGEGKTVSFAGLALSGADAANYSLSGQPEDTTANITAKPVTITGVTAEDKVYDGNSNATVVTDKAAIDGIVGSEDLSFVPGTGTFSNKNVGKDKTVSFSYFALTGNDSANYTLASQPADTTADITAKEVKVSGIKAGNKTYDGTTGATLDCTSASFDGKLDDDVLTVTANGAFEDANAGQDKTVNITGLTLGGDSKGNYILASEDQQTTDQADIAQKSITEAKVTLDKTQLTYNGQEQSVSVTGVKTSDGMTLTANDYEIVSGNTGTDIGDYTVIIEGKGNYKDEATADWKIVEKVSPTPTPTPTKVSGTEMAKMTAKGKTSATIAWNKIQGASGYDIFFARCNHNGKKVAFKKVKTIKGNKTFKWTATKLKKNTSYKAYVKAYVTKNGKKTYVRTSPMLHVYTGNASGKYTNAKSVTVNKAKVSLKKGKTYKIKAKVNKIKKDKKLMPKSHVATLRYLTSNSKVATVSKSGKITAKGKGSCVVYAYAHNGVSKSIKVTVP